MKDINSQGGSALAETSNVLDASTIVENSIKKYGSVDILINNAGILRDKSFHKLTDEEWNAVIDVHLHGTYRLCHAVWPKMQQNMYGRIVNVTSGAGKRYISKRATLQSPFFHILKDIYLCHK